MISPKERAARLPEPIKLPKLLLAEGETPTHFFEALLIEMGLSDTIEIHNYGGNSELAKTLRALAATAEFRRVESILVTRDAEDDPNAASKSVDSAIKSISLGQSVKIQVAILPSELLPGMIETLCLSSVEGQPHFGCITDFFTSVEGKGVAIPSGPVRAKHVAQVYLATTEWPQKMPGTAAYKKVWPFDHPAFEPLRMKLANM